MLVYIVILAALLDEKLTIYKIKKKIDSLFSVFYSASLGSIHPALKKLLEEGYVAVNKSTSPGGQRRSVYSITTKGKKYFEEIMLNSELSEQIIKIKILLLPKMEKNLQIPIINNISDFYKDRLLDLENFEQNHPSSYVKHCINAISDEISWINRQKLL